jgi:hypothetical protein
MAAAGKELSAGAKPALRSLALTWVAATARDLRPATLARLVTLLPCLEHLTLAWHRAVDDTVLAALALAPCAAHLQSANFTYTTVTSEGIIHLAVACPRLRWLKVSRSHVSRREETAAAVAAARPHCTIEF